MAVRVKTTSGELVGTERDGVHSFRGIPYAAPPVGDLRFRRPERPTAWEGLRDSAVFGPSVPQTRVAEPLGSVFAAVAPPGDDCLNLNVWSPSPGSDTLPVLVWVHGGGFQNGAGSDPIYDGSAFARDGVVMVSMNYRLGVQGFLYLEDEPGAGNLGMLDQVSALEWVQENIAAFGGDPGNVTIAGESAGGICVATLLAMPDARGLFRRAIAQSGAAHNTIAPATAAAVTSVLAQAVGVDPKDTEALRSVPLEQLLAAEQEIQERSFARQEPKFGDLMLSSLPIPFQPVYGTDALPDRPINAVRNGSAAGIDLLVGITAEELLAPLRVVPEVFGVEPEGDLPPATVDMTADLIFGASGISVDHAVTVYRQRRPHGSNLELLAALLTDWVFRIPAIRLAEAQSDHAVVYAYELALSCDGADGRWGAGHALDLPLVFDTCESVVGQYVTGGTAPAAVVDVVHGAWVEFVTGGEPRHSELPRWVAYSSDRRATMRLDVHSDVIEDPDADIRQLWEGVL